LVRAYLPDCTPGQAAAAAAALARLDPVATPAEVCSGEALNALLRDIAEARAGVRPGGSLPLREGVLRRLNVTSVAGGCLAAFRARKLFDWPEALRGVVGDRERRDLEAAAGNLYWQAREGRVNDRLLRKLEDAVVRLGAGLRDRAQEVPMDQFLRARQFLGELGKAVVAFRGGVALRVEQFAHFARGGRPAEEVAGHLIARRLTFAPAAPADEDAYLATYIALAHHRAGLVGGPGAAGGR
jgi:hypothetical protein